MTEPRPSTTYRTRRARSKVDANQGSELEIELNRQLTLAGVTGFVREYHFHPVRQWRYDFAFPSAMLAIEAEGGTWIKGHHNRGQGFEDDCEKYNEAAILGWHVLRFTGKMINDGTALKYILAALRAFAPEQAAANITAWS